MSKKKQTLSWSLRDARGECVQQSDKTPAHSLRVITSTGGRIDVELWERSPGEITIRVLDGHMIVKPEASNTIVVRNRTYIEEAVEASKRVRRKRA